VQEFKKPPAATLTICDSVEEQHSVSQERIHSVEGSSKDKLFPDSAKMLTPNIQPTDENGYKATQQFKCETVTHFAMLELMRMISEGVTHQKKHRIILDYDPDARYYVVTSFQASDDPHIEAQHS